MFLKPKPTNFQQKGRFYKTPVLASHGLFGKFSIKTFLLQINPPLLVMHQVDGKHYLSHAS